MYKNDRWLWELMAVGVLTIIVMILVKVPANGVFCIPFGIVFVCIMVLADHDDKRKDVEEQKEEEWQRIARCQNEQNMKKSLGLE